MSLHDRVELSNCLHIILAGICIAYFCYDVVRGLRLRLRRATAVDTALVPLQTNETRLEVSEDCPGCSTPIILLIDQDSALRKMCPDSNLRCRSDSHSNPVICPICGNDEMLLRVRGREVWIWKAIPDAIGTRAVQ